MAATFFDEDSLVITPVSSETKDYFFEKKSWTDPRKKSKGHI